MLARGWEVHYIRESETQEAGEFEGIIVHSIPRQRKLLKWKNWYHLRRVMDVVRANVWYVRANISYLPLVVWHSRKTKGNSIWSFSRDSQFDSKARNIKGRVLHNLFAQLDHFAFYKALQYVDGILLQTEFQKRLLLENLRLSGTVIHNAHPIPKEVPASKENKVLWIGRLQEFKHPERFVEIAKILQDSPISFELVGDSSNNRVIDEICRRSTSLSNFQWLGGTSLKDVHRLIDSSRVLVNTSAMWKPQLEGSIIY
jgi:glycosyltransferase involved in cell wall biosynthesis